MKFTTNQSKSTCLLRCFFVFVVLLCSTVSHSQDLAQIKKLCGNVSPQNKAMAKQAGYDLDVLCSEVSVAASPSKGVVPASILVERDTVSSPSYVSGTVASMGAISNTKKPQPSLKPFGYDLFANAPTTFAPAASIAVSDGYLLGPGDTLDILFYGKENRTFSLEINREGFVDFPDLGPVGLAGLTYGEAKKMLQARISSQTIGTQVSISMGLLRSMQIFVLGEAFKPGAYTVSSLSTVTHALINSGGVTDIGSLRNIQLKREGKVIAELDLYDLLLSGDTSNDARIQEGDVIYIPTVGDQVSINGQVLRPAIYELKGGESIEDLIELSGGLGSKAFPGSSRLQRINDDGFLTVLDLDVKKQRDRDIVLKGGDYFTVDKITDYKKDIITLSGAVRHKGEFSWREGMRLLDIISDRDMLDHQADLDIALLVRELKNSADLVVYTFSLENLFSNATGTDNLKLEPRDRIVVFADYQNRAEVMAPFIKNLKRQASIDGMARVVTASGKVRFPGEYPFTEAMTLQDLIVLSGGLLDSTYSQTAEISRLDLSDPNRAVRSSFILNLASSSPNKLLPSDRVTFRAIPEYQETRNISLEGEFVFPGTYVFGKGETLTSVIRRAGGFTDEAFIDGSVFLRELLRKREEKEIDRLVGLLNDEIADAQLRNFNSGMGADKIDVDAQEAAVSSLLSTVATGRMVIPLADIMANRTQDLILTDGDRLIIPKFSQAVSVLGEVRRPSSYLYNPNFKKSDYIKQSGGFKDRADKKSIYIVKADGTIIMPKKGLFVFRSEKNSISSGDTIVVPLDADETEIHGIELLAEVTQIIYQLSLGAAAINSLNNN